MSTESESPTTRRVELSDGNWIELRRKRTVADARHQRMRRHERGDFDDDTLDELSLIEARVAAWSFMDGKVPSDMNLRAQIIDGLEEEDAIALVLANRGVDENPFESRSPSDDSPTGTPQNEKKAKPKKRLQFVEESVQTNG